MPMKLRSNAAFAEHAIVGLALVTLGGFMAWNLHSEHLKIEARERLRLADQARIIDDNLGPQLGAVNNALISLQKDLAYMLGREDGPRILQQRLQALSGAMPGVRTLFVLNGEGRAIASNREALVGQELKERAYFQLARRSNDPAILHVSSPIRTALGTFAINLERSTRDAHGRFTGLVAATLDPEYFTTLLNSVNYTADTWTSLIHADGTLFIVVPDQGIPPGTRLARQGSLFNRHMDSGQRATVFSGRILATGDWRMVARRTVQPAGLPMDAPLVISVTRNLTAVFAPWQKDLWQQIRTFSLLTLAAGGALFAHQRRQNSLAQIEALRQAALSSSEEQMRLFFDRQRVGMAITSPRMGWVKVNDRLCQMLGYAREELLSKTWMEVTHPQDLPRDLAIFNRLLVGELQEYSHEKRYIRKDGSILHTELSVGCVRHEDGSINYVLAVLTDMTEYRQVQEALSRILREQEIILENANVGISLIVERRQVWINPWMEKVFQYPRNELEGHSTEKLYPSLAAYQALGLAAYPALSRGESFETVQELRRRDGTQLWIHYNGKAIAPPDLTKGTLWILTDVTARELERARFEQERALHERALEQLNQSLETRVQESVSLLRVKDQMLISQSRQAALGEMIENIAHQWRQPLNALSLVLMNFQDARQFQDLDQGRFDSLLQRGNALVQKLSTTINDFRDFSRQDKHRVNVSALEQVRSTVALVEPSFAAKGIEIVIETTADIRIHGLPNEFSQVFMNLLSNGKQAILAQALRKGRISIHLQEKDGQGCLQVRDNGGGIPEEHLERIFELYFSTREAGTGIGLYLSRQIIEQSLKGRILVRNTEEGAEFTVLIPLAGAPS